ncbi:MAG TPA: nuclear transport factor 2 family protein [Acidobacteriaceae bacterium]
MHPHRRARRLTARDGAIVLLLASCLPGIPVPGHAAPLPLLHREDRLHREIENLEAQWRTALMQNDVATINRLLADDYLGINPNGTLETKADALAQRRSGTVKISSIEPENQKIRVYGDTAVVTSRVQVEGHDGAGDISGLYHYTRVYSRRSGEWKVVSFEASRIPPGSKH